jgi:hypothetical protein
MGFGSRRITDPLRRLDYENNLFFALNLGPVRLMLVTISLQPLLVEHPPVLSIIISVPRVQVDAHTAWPSVLFLDDIPLIYYLDRCV